MNILLISDSSDKSILGSKVKEELTEFLQKNNYTYKKHEISKDDLHYCIGCFSCWLKTPGECSFNDISRDINKDYIHSDIAIFLSPVKYGCYSVAIRRILDRILPNILPFFKKNENEIHHAPRYSSYPGFVTIGYGADITDEEAETFKSLSHANAANFQANKDKAYIVRMETDIHGILETLDQYLKEGINNG